MDNIDRELLKALKLACPAQLWGVRGGSFVLDTGAAEKFYSRADVGEILNRERAALEVKAGLIQTALDLLEPEAPFRNCEA